MQHRVRFLWLTLALALPTQSAAAPCGLGPIATSTLSGAGCTVGSATFSNFDLSAGTLGAGASALAIDPAHVDVTFTATPGSIALVFTNDTPSSWSVSGNELFTLDIAYSVSSPSAIFLGAADSVTGSAGSSGLNSGQIQMTLTADTLAFPSIGLIGPSGEITLANGVTGFAGAPLSSFVVHDQVQVQASNAGAVLVNMVNSFAVPEPSCLVFVGVATVGLGLAKRRARPGGPRD